MFDSLFRVRAGVPAAVFTVLGSAFVDAQTDHAELLERVSAYVEQYYTRAQTLVATEKVVLQPINRDMSSRGLPRRIVNEIRVEWDPAQRDEPRTVRHALDATGPTLGPPGQPDCLDPRSFSPEPLAFLLRERRDRFRFEVRGTERIGELRARRIDYVPLRPEPPRVRWEGKCGTIETRGRTRGRILVDPGSGEVLRFTERLIGLVELPGPPRGPEHLLAPRWFTMERADTTIDYHRVAFADPDEMLLLPRRVESVTVIRESGIPRLLRHTDIHRLPAVPDSRPHSAVTVTARRH